MPRGRGVRKRREAGCGSAAGCGGARSALPSAVPPRLPHNQGPGDPGRSRSAPALPGPPPRTGSRSRVAGRPRRTGRRLRLPPTGSGVCASPVNAASDGSTRGSTGPVRTRNNQKTPGAAASRPGPASGSAAPPAGTQLALPLRGSAGGSMSPSHPLARGRWSARGFFLSPRNLQSLSPRNQTKPEQLLAVDHSVRASMKNAASCEN